jgi:hypothetical protein
MKLIRTIASYLLVAALVACGGGGGSPGTVSTASGSTATGTSTSTGSGSSTSTQTATVTAVPTITLEIVNSVGVVITDNSISSGATSARATVKDATGAPVVNKLVTFTVNAAIATLAPVSGQVLTDGAGIAKVQIQPASVSTTGAASLGVSANVSGQGVSANIDVQTSASNVVLASLTPNVVNLSAYQATSVVVDATINGNAATAGQVTVNFSAPCGSFAPASVSTNSLGKAVTTFTASGCSGGAIALTASASGAQSPVNANINIQTAAATSLVFVSATPATIFSTQALFGEKTSRVTFKLVDSGGVGIDGSTINLSLSSAAVAAGVVFSDTGLTTTTQATSGGGLVSVNVNSGSVPTPLSVNAQLAANVLITASSGGLAVNSGAPVQDFFSISASSFNIEGFNYDGEISDLTIYAADRLAQPVPNGTVITFVAEGGQITASCPTTINANGKSGCSVSLQSQASRPTNGRVSVLAYTEGVEPFKDDNGDNVFTPGEAFVDLGQPFIDANENGVFDAGEQKIGTSGSAGIGSTACAASLPSFGFIPSSVPNTCNATQGRALVRANAVIVFSTNFASTATITLKTGTGFKIQIPDENGNAMPRGSVVTADVVGGASCTLKRVIPATVPSTTEPTTHTVVLDPGTVAAGCQGASVTVSIKTPKGNETPFKEVIIP